MVTSNDNSRREFIKKAVYVVPAVLSLNLALAEASAASIKRIHKPKVRGDGGRWTGIPNQRDVTR